MSAGAASVEGLLDELRHRDVRLWADGETLRYDAPKGALTPELVAELRRLKGEVLAFLERAKEAAVSSPGGIPRIPRDGPLPLSFAQQRLWFLAKFQAGEGEASYNMPGAVRLAGALDVGALERALSEIVRRHETLRTTFPAVDGEAVQRVAEPQPVELPVKDLSSLSAARRRRKLERLAREEAEAPFDLEVGPLLRLRLVRLGGEEHVLLANMHHIVSDGWSLGIFLRELGALYTAFSQGRSSALPELPIAYADYAAWQRQELSGEALAALLAYWKEQLSGAPPLLELPTDHPRPPVQTFRGAKEAVRLDGELTAALNRLSREEGVTLFMTLLAAFQVLLGRYSGQDEVVVGSPIANRRRGETEDLIGFFVNTLVLRTRLDGDPSFRQLLRRVEETALDAFKHQDAPFEQLVEALHPERNLSQTPLFQVMLMLQNAPGGVPQLPGLEVSVYETPTTTAKFDLTLSLTEVDGALRGELEYKTDLFEADTVQRMAGHLEVLLRGAVADPDQPISRLPLLGRAEERRILEEWNDTAAPLDPAATLPALFRAQAARTPERQALLFEGRSLTYREVDERATALARYLAARGVGPGSLVGLAVERSPEMVVGLLGILASRAAYAPLDPASPPERLGRILEDAFRDLSDPLLLTQERLLARLPEHRGEAICLDRDGDLIAQAPPVPLVEPAPEDRAYVLFTSGSTGRPKGVEVEHRHVVSFFVGMDRALGEGQAEAEGEPPGTWLAVTTVSFDISVLELLWTLTRGFRVVIQGEEDKLLAASGVSRASSRPMDFSLFYFTSAGDRARGREKYRLLLEGARFADAHGFSAVWTPERHFHDFGDLYPNPSVTGAAVAAVTERVGIRAGSVVLPLHDPIRVAEEWSVVDNLSDGRVGVSFASGWQANDFVLAPESYEERKEILAREIDTVRRLWRGEAVERADGKGKVIEVRTLPRPVQEELPFWVTAAGSPETFRLAGESGAHLLSHLLGQSVEELGERIRLYRQAWKEAGHPGRGTVSLMLHTFVGEDEATVRETVREPFCEYLKSSFGLLRNLAASLGLDLADKDLSAADMDALLAHAFERYYRESGLFGTPQICAAMVERLKAIDVDEIACLIDFGVEADAVLSALELLDRVRREANPPAVAEGSTFEESSSEESYDLPAQVERHAVTHLQCTPAFARMLTVSDGGRAALGALDELLVGGEELPLPLARDLLAAGPGAVRNMYGPTETTVWSSTHRLAEPQAWVPIGRPIANTSIYVLGRHLEPVPAGVPGDLFIGGRGVVRGYLGRPGMTAERFVPDPFREEPGARMYRTGDLARWRGSGELEFLGRADHQVKIRGFRIELGEVEAALNDHPGVRQAVVVARSEGGDAGNRRLVAYLVAAGEGTRGDDGSLEVAQLRRFLAGKLPEYMIPSLFVALDEMPRTPNGKVDRKALPAPEAGGRSGVFLAPRDALEIELAGLWEELLDAHPVGVTDNFFELGGHSLLAVQLMTRIEGRLGKALPLSALFQGPTVEQLASILRAGGHERRTPLVLIQKGSDAARRPVFCLPGAGGNVIYYYDLARHLGSDLTLYGLQPVLDEGEPPAESLVPELARRYLDAMKSVQPQGPYLLVGHSFGGLLGYEMALQLGRRGETVDLLAVLDTIAPLPKKEVFGAGWNQARWVELFSRTIGRVYHRDLGVTYDDLAVLEPEAQVDFLAERMRSFGYLPPEADREQFRLFFHLFRVDQQAIYTPEEVYAGKITVFRAQELHPDNVPIAELAWTTEDPPMGWGRLSAQPVEVHRVPGDHLTLMTEPHVRALAARLRESLDRVEAGASPPTQGELVGSQRVEGA